MYAALTILIMVPATATQITSKLQVGKLISLLIGVALLIFGYWSHYQNSFLRRRMSLVDSTYYAFIEARLAATGKSFGGYVSWNWPRTNFMNQSLAAFEDLGVFAEEYEIYRYGPPLPKPGYCVYWEGGKRNFDKLTKLAFRINGSAHERVRSFSENTHKQEFFKENPQNYLGELCS